MLVFVVLNKKISKHRGVTVSLVRLSAGQLALSSPGKVGYYT